MSSKDSVSRAHQIKAEQEQLVASLSDDELFKQLRGKVMDVFTHKTKPSTMRIPVDYAHDDDCYVSLRLQELKRRWQAGTTEVRERDKLIERAIERLEGFEECEAEWIREDYVRLKKPKCQGQHVCYHCQAPMNLCKCDKAMDSGRQCKHEYTNAHSEDDQLRCKFCGEPASGSPIPTSCEWFDDDDGWHSSCGRNWEFTYDGPKENGLDFCMKCGKRVTIAQFVDGRESS